MVLLLLSAFQNENNINLMNNSQGVILLYSTFINDYDYELVLLRHTISTMYYGIIFKSCKKDTTYYKEVSRKVCCPLA